MSKKDMRKLIEDKIGILNETCKSLSFSFEDGEVFCSVKNSSLAKGKESNSFGLFSYTAFIDELGSKEGAYEACIAFLDGLLGGLKLLDPKAYHNLIMGVL